MMLTTSSYAKDAIKNEWLGNKIGITDDVPEPFAPIEISNKSIRLWKKEFLLSARASIFDNINILNKQFLSGPVEVKPYNKNILTPLRSSETWRKNSLSSFHFIKKTFYEGFILENTVKVEYDGFVSVTTNIIPEKQIELTHLSIEIPIKKSFATLYSHYFLDMPLEVRKAFGGDKDFRGSLMPDRDTVFEFSPIVWIGNEDMGLSWFTETDAGWNLEDKKKAIEILAGKEKVTLKIHFIDRPISLKRPVSFSWGLMPTPVKPFPDLKNYIQLYTAQEDSAEQIINKWLFPIDKEYSKLDEAAKTGLKSILIHQLWNEFPGYPGTFDEKKKALLKKVVNEAHKRGLKVILYIGKDMPVDSPEGKKMMKSFIKEPSHIRKRKALRKYKSFTTDANRFYNDFLIYKVKILIDEFNIDGIMLDGHNMVVPCINQRHGHGTKINGTVIPVYPISETRELMKRLYWLFHVYKQNGIIIAHAETPFLPSLSFADLRWVGEGLVWRWRNQYSASENKPITQLLPLEEFRGIYAGYNLGIPLIFLAKPKVGPMIAKDRISSISLIHGVLPRFQHPPLTCPEKCDDQDKIIWEIYRNWLDMSENGKWEFYPYWNNKGPLKMLAPNNNAKLSYHYNDKKDEAVLYISNFDLKDTRAVVSVNGKDGDNWICSPITDTLCKINKNQLEVALKAMGYGVIKIRKAAKLP